MLIIWKSEACKQCGMKKAARIVDCRNIVSPTWQCSSSHSIVSSRVLGKAFNFRSSAASLLTWLIPTRHFSVPQNKNDPWMEKDFKQHREHHYDYDRWTDHDSTDIFWTVLANMKRQWERCITAQGYYFKGMKCNCAVTLEINLLLTNSTNFLKKPHTCKRCQLKLFLINFIVY